ncbi:MAG: DUF998 domain-containing protein [Anaerolineales bacterium]
MFKTILTPAAGSSSHASATAVVLVLVFSFGSLLAAPLLMPDSYHWIEHTTSESAAQGVEGAWLARMGFLLLGLAVIWLAVIRKVVWPRAAVWMHTAFGVFMVATAAFSVRPWIEGLPYDPIEDALHSFTATAMGFAFAFGVLARLLRRQRADRLGQLLDVVALAASVGIPLIMVYQADIGGLVQRLMFLIAYLWYARETVVKED